MHLLPPTLVPCSILLTSSCIGPLHLCSLAIMNWMALTNPPTYFHLQSKHPCQVFIIKDLILCRINCWWNVVQCVHGSNFFIFGDIPKEWFFRPFILQWNLFMMLVFFQLHCHIAQAHYTTPIHKNNSFLNHCQIISWEFVHFQWRNIFVVSLITPYVVKFVTYFHLVSYPHQFGA